MTILPQNPFFVGRQAELETFAQLLQTDDALMVLNVHGHSGVGKTWLLEEFRCQCAVAAIPFAFLNPREVSDDPVSLLTGFARRLPLPGDWTNTGHNFDQALSPFITALLGLETPAVMLMLDNYDQMFRFDPQVRHLIRALTRQAPPDGSLVDIPPPATGPRRFIVVIGSEQPLTQLWPPSPLYRQPLQMMPLCDFTFQEISLYLERLDVPVERHPAIFRVTQGYPLALALIVSLESWPQATDTADYTALLTQEDRERFVQSVLEGGLRSLETLPERPQVLDALYASTQVRRFSRALLAAMLRQADLPDEVFDRLTRLSMVVKHRHPQSALTFSLHAALRAALEAKMKARDLKHVLASYRERALAFYTLQQAHTPHVDPEWGLDVLFLHSHPLIHSMFFDVPTELLVTELANFEELDALIEPLMRACPLYEDIGFTEETLSDFIAQTRTWLTLDYRLHGETLRYFRVVRRNDRHRDIVGFVLNVPATAETLDLLRQDTTTATVQQCSVPLEINPRRCFALRIAVDEWDSLSALVRTIFTQVSAWEFDLVEMVLPWPLIAEMVTYLGFDVLARGVQHEGITYTVAQLDVAQHGGAARWLLNLAREDLGLPSRRLLQDWALFKETLQAALASLHDSFELLAESPLIDEFALVERTTDDWTRAESLTKVLRETLETMRLPDEHDRPDTAFHVLNESYGIVDTAWQRFEFSTGRPSIEEIAGKLYCAKNTLRKRLDEALEAFARAFRRQIGKP